MTSMKTSGSAEYRILRRSVLGFTFLNHATHALLDSYRPAEIAVGNLLVDQKQPSLKRLFLVSFAQTDQ